MERLLVAVAGCLHGHDVVNRIMPMQTTCDCYQ